MKWTPRVWMPGVLLITGVFLMFTTSLHAEIIKWKDDQGKIHYTNDRSKIPKQFRNPARMEKLRGVAGQRPASAPANAQTDEESDDILTKEDEALIKQAKKFLKDEQAFAKKHRDSALMPTQMRVFFNAYTKLTGEREAMKKKLEGSKVPAIQQVVAHINATLETAKAYPVSMRKMSVATTIGRVKTEVSGNDALISSLDGAVEKSKKSKEEQDKKEQEAE